MDDKMEISDKLPDSVILEGSEFQNDSNKIDELTENNGETNQPINQPVAGDKTGATPQEQGIGHFPPQGYPGEPQGYPHGDGTHQYPHTAPKGQGGGYPQYHPTGQPVSGYPHAEQNVSGYPTYPQNQQPGSEYHQTGHSGSGYPPQNPQTGQPGSGYPQNPHTGQPGSGYPHSPQTGQPGSGYPQNPHTGQPGSGYPQSPQTGPPRSGYPQNPQTGLSEIGYPRGQAPGINQPYGTTSQYQPSQGYPNQPYFDSRFNSFMWYHPQRGWEPGPPPYQGPYQQHQQQPQEQQMQQQDGHGNQQQQHDVAQHRPATPPPTYAESMVIVEPEHEKIFIKDQRRKEEFIDANRQQDKGFTPPDGVISQNEEERRAITLDEGTPAYGVEVYGLPAGVSSDTISLYFENKRRSGGGAVSSVEMVDKCVARVFFDNIDAFKRVLAKKDHMISNQPVKVRDYTSGPSDTNTTPEEEKTGSERVQESEVYQRAQEVHSPESKGDNPMSGPDIAVDDVPVDTIVVRGADEIFEETVQLYFENKRKSGGGVVKEIVTSPSGHLLITFEDFSVIERVLSKEHKLNDRVLEVSLYTPPAPTPEPQTEDDPQGPPDTIVVRNIGSMTDDILTMYFENKRKGGGDVKEIRRVGDDTVHITFEIPEVVASVLQKAPHRFENQDLDVSVYFPEKVSTEPPPPPTTVLVQGCRGVAKELLEMYFESSRRSGGGELEGDITGDDEEGFLVTFKDPEIAAAVCLREHSINEKPLQVSLVTQQANNQQQSASRSPTSYDKDLYWVSSSDDDEEDDSMYVLEVKGITHDMSEDTLELFFENRRRSGGDEIECFELDRASGTLLVYFKEPNVVKRVLQKAPLLLDNKQLSVSAYLPGSQQAVSQDSPLKGLKDGVVVMISGFHSESSDETLELYFENKRRSGGEDIKEIRTVETEEGCVKYIVYNSTEVAERVASKTHKVDGKQINASLYKAPTPPPPKAKYPNKFLIKGLKESTPRDTLLEYMKEKLNCQPKDLAFGDEPGTVLVTLDCTDIRKKLKKMKKIAKKRPLQGAYLYLSSVPISNCLLVSGLDKKTTETTLGLYFESRKSGNVKGSDVEKVVMVEDSNNALVYFQDHNAIQLVLDKAHKLDGRNLKARLYTECLGVGGGQKDPNWFKLPKPFTIGDLDPYKLKFINDSKVNKKNLEKQLEGGCARIKSMTKTSITLECILTKDAKDARKKVKIWRKEVEDDITHFLELLITEKVNVLQQVWTDVMDKIQTLKIHQPEAATLFVFDESNQIVVVGHKMPAENLLKKIQEMVDEVENIHERKKQEITESVTMQKPLQLLLLMASGFHRSMMEKFDGMRVEINNKKNEITFIGLMYDVKNARIKMYESCNEFKETFVIMSDAQIQFVKKKAFKQYLMVKLKQKNLCGVWEENDQKLRVLSRSDKEVTEVAHMVKESACQQDIDLDMESVPLLASAPWKQLCDTQTQNNGELVRIIPAANRSKIVLVATDELIASLAEDVNNFIKDNTVYEDTVRFPKGIQRFMVRHYENEIKNLETKFQSYSVEIKFRKNSTEFTVKGTKHGLQIITSELVKLSEDVMWKKHVFDKPGIAKLIQSEKGDSHILNIEGTERCIIEKNHDETEQVSFGDRKRQRIMHTVTGGPKVVASCALGSGRKIHVSQGDITKMQVGAVVNAANQQLAHIGGLAKAIVDRAGESVQDESKDIVRRRGDIGVGKVAVTGPGKLSCNFIIHAVGPIWSHGRNDDESLLQEAIFNCLEEAGRRKLNSIAIPALSTGIYQYPVGDATKAIVEAIQMHFGDNPSSSLQDVFVCDNNVNTVQQFSKALERQFGKANVQTSNLNVSDQEVVYYREDTEEKPSPRPGRRQHRSNRPGRRFYVNDNEQQSRRAGGSSTIRAYHVLSEIAKEKVDVIVNTTSSQLDLTNGAVSKSLLQAGGTGIQQECSSNYPNGIKPGQFAVTSGGNMSCKMILHTCLPNWNHGDQRMLADLVKSCLRQASRDNCGSVAFPALGTGNLRYPADIVAQTMYDAVDDFSSSNPSSSVQEVKFVLYHRDTATVKAFQDCERDRGAAGGGGGASGSRKGRKFGGMSSHETTDHDDDGFEHISSSDVEGVFTIGGVKLTVKQGNLTKEKVKCIVNSTNTELDLSIGAVSKELVRVGGSDLLDEIALKTHEMSKKGVIISSAKGLKASYIVHVSADFFRQDWKKAIIKTLKEAENGVNVTSIAFPALGTGQHSATPESIAQKLIEAVVEYGKSGSVHKITDIRMVIYQEHMLGPFLAAVHKAFSTLKGEKGLFKKAYDWVVGSEDNPKAKAEIRYGTQDSSTAVLYFFSDEDDTISHAIRRVNQHYTDNTFEQMIRKEILKNPSASLKKKIENLRLKHGVHLDYDKWSGKVRINGLTADVVKVADEVHQIIHDTQTQAHESEKAKMLSNFVQWSFIDNGTGGSGKAEEYDKIANQTLERAYNDKKNTVKITDTKGQEYIVDFQNMVEYPVGNPRDKVAVVRKEKISGGGAFEPPAQWTPMTSDCELVQVAPGTQEYTHVEQQFTATLGRAQTVQQAQMFVQVLPVSAYHSQNPSVTVQKTGRGVPLLIPNEVKRMLDFLSDAECREKGGIKPGNGFMFGNTGDGVIRAGDALNEVKQHPKLKLDQPNRILATNLRKYTATIAQIQRVQNKYLWQQYVAKKQQLDSQNPQGHQNERILWHGTSLDAVPSIYKHGFNRSYCGKNAVAIGNGVYFAVNTSYSSSNTYSVPDHNGHKHMFMAKVLTGQCTRGKGGLRVPPLRDQSNTIHYDSVADNPANPGMFVIFNDTQAYPDYLITFM